MAGSVIVTGASSGIGAAIARLLGRRGRFVGLVARRQDELTAVLDDIQAAGGHGVVLPCDITQIDRLDEIAKEFERVVSGPIAIVNNAGFGGPFVPAHELDVVTWDYIFDVNVRAAYYLCKMLTPRMMADRDGSVINISSVYAMATAANSAAYTASKCALVGLTKALAIELGPHGIRVNAICPGFISTAMVTEEHPASRNQTAVEKRIPLGTMGTVEQIASVVAALCTDEFAYVNGAIWTVDGGLSAALSVPSPEEQAE